MLVDSHCHLNEFADVEMQVSKARQAGVMLMVSNSVDLKSMQDNLRIAHAFESVSCALGLHPNELSKMDERTIEEALSFIEKHSKECVAIGETGLDFKCASKQQRKIQLEAFAKHIELAERFDKPVIVHSRAARKECIELLERNGAKKVLMHWFVASEKLLAKVLELGYFVSIGPSVLFNEYVQRFAQSVPLKNILLETDAPVSYNGMRAEPCWISKVASKLADIKGCPAKDIERITWENFLRLFGRDACVKI
ncbi:MAG: TatD family hydrolase [Candidatus Diapherotrites archaeon]|nr:TatD family hydrolase [Candidatus Diapherotrites archaeon]